MSDYRPGRLDFDDDYVLPWLEPAAEEPVQEGLSPLRLLGLLLLGLVLVSAVVGGIWLIRDGSHAGGGDEGQLIAAPTDPYKIAANEADARKFDGEGDASFAASEGVARDGRIDPTRVPEAPIAKTAPAPAPTRSAVAEKPAQSVTARVTDETAVKPVAAPRVTGGAMVQLGAYASASGAKDAWGRLSKRFAYLSPLTMTVEPAQVGGGTVYRLRAAAGGQASTICGKLKVAGESCLVVN